MLRVYHIETIDYKEMFVKTEDEARQILIEEYPNGHWLGIGKCDDLISERGHWLGGYRLDEMIQEDEVNMYQWFDCEYEDDD